VEEVWEDSRPCLVDPSSGVVALSTAQHSTAADLGTARRKEAQQRVFSSPPADHPRWANPASAPWDGAGKAFHSALDPGGAQQSINTTTLATVVDFQPQPPRALD
jgi:hypothetical protein